MRRIMALPILLLPTLLLPHGAAHAEAETGFYVEAQLGASLPDSVDASNDGIDGSVDFNDAFVAGGAVGYRFPWARLELNGSWRDYDVDQVNAPGFASGGSGNATAVIGFVNLFLDPDLGWPVRPFVGGGIGGAYLSVDTGDDAPIRIDDNTGAFAWNVGGGLSVDVAQHVTLSVGYRFVSIAGTDFSSSVAGVDTGDLDVDDFRTHEVLVGLRYTF